LNGGFIVPAFDRNKDVLFIDASARSGKWTPEPASPSHAVRRRCQPQRHLFCSALQLRRLSTILHYLPASYLFRL